MSPYILRVNLEKDTTIDYKVVKMLLLYDSVQKHADGDQHVLVLFNGCGEIKSFHVHAHEAGIESGNTNVEKDPGSGQIGSGG